MRRAVRSCGSALLAGFGFLFATQAALGEPAPAKAPPAAAASKPATTDSAGALALFKEAKELIGKGETAKACAMFEQSLALEAAVGTEFNLADCWERLGKTASAHARFVKVADETQLRGETDRSELARKRADALESKLSRIRIEAKAEGGLEIRRDDVLVAPATFGVPLPVDPGTYEIKATAPGKKTWSTKVVVPADPGTVVIGVPALEAEAPVAPEKKAEEPKAEPKKESPKPKPVEEESDPGAVHRTAGLIVGGIGVVGVVAGFAMLARYKANQEDAEAICPSSTNCSTSEIQLHADLVDEARTARTWGYIGLAAGGAALFAGGYLLITAPKSKEQETALTLKIGPVVDGRGRLGAAVRGSF